jgi:hypothetical protein
MQDVLTSADSKEVRLYVVWLPIIRSDDRESAVERTKEFPDPRVSYYWDDAGITGMAWKNLLNLQTVAWDVYFLYPRNVTWNKTPGEPVFWMHQLRGVDAAPYLAKDEFKSMMLKTLDSEKEK